MFLQGTVYLKPNPPLAPPIPRGAAEIVAPLEPPAAEVELAPIAFPLVPGAVAMLPLGFVVPAPKLPLAFVPLIGAMAAPPLGSAAVCCGLAMIGTPVMTVTLLVPGATVPGELVTAVGVVPPLRIVTIEPLSL
jgi:hypothetical protein